ncbi:LysR family transcriptional regulator [Rhodoferax sp. TH121]|uniref:LysR family transcriptional regulator n=1 Tax=Rhodoferax sp. TH121 TaxID=2022803 RepID=UPI00159515AB|nr:LysR family transcriptional regulator [Rhodoferax sp. TH121]
MPAPIDLRKVQHAQWLAQELSFSKAAALANLSQTAFSRSIQVLESELGLRLFDRGTRFVQVTSAGAKWLEHAADVLAKSNTMRALAQDLADGDGGELAMGASLLAVSGVLSGVLNTLRQQRPKLRLRVECSQWEVLLEHLLADRIELFIGYPAMLAADPRYRVTPLAPQPVSLYARNGHPLAACSQLSPQHLVAYPWACIQMPPEIAGSLRHLLRQVGISEFPIQMECDNQTLLREALLCSDTLVLTWESWLAEDIAQGRVVELASRIQPALPAHLLQLQCAIVQHSHRTLSPAAHQLINLIAPQSQPMP